MDEGGILTIDGTLQNSSEPLGIIWLDCEPYSVVTVGLKRTLEEQARVHVGPTGPSDPPSFVILCSDGVEGVSERVRLAKEACPDTPILVDRKSTRLNSSHANISYAVFCLKKK